MNLRIINTLLLLFVLTIAYGQKKFEINGIVKSKNGGTVSFATIGVENTTIGTISNGNGKFTIYLDSLKSVTLKLYCLGYEEGFFNISKDELHDTLILSLTDLVYVLPEVVILPKKYIEYKAGYTESDSKRFVKFKIDGRKKSNLGSSIGKLIKVKNNAILNKVSFFLKDNDFSNLKFRIKLLDENLNLLFPDNIIVTVENQKTGWITKTLTNKVNLPKKTVVVIEWVESSNDGSILTMPMKIPKFGSKHYYKYGAVENWKKYKHITSSIFVEYVVEKN